MAVVHAAFRLNPRDQSGEDSIKKEGPMPFMPKGLARIPKDKSEKLKEDAEEVLYLYLPTDVSKAPEVVEYVATDEGIRLGKRFSPKTKK